MNVIFVPAGTKARVLLIPVCKLRLQAPPLFVPFVNQRSMKDEIPLLCPSPLDAFGYSFVSSHKRHHPESKNSPICGIVFEHSKDYI